ncbi:hypothetical protein AV654_25775 [Paenibacillus elgii]|uniref:Uncharacterized protein n=1 Tax=Paenibacillus elgii TaxID=189691 RepID=A0A165QP64_9BACL|nr:hypothetical protein AV654_25775 [Paenibacillus elgii]
MEFPPTVKSKLFALEQAAVSTSVQRLITIIIRKAIAALPVEEVFIPAQGGKTPQTFGNPRV